MLKLTLVTLLGAIQFVQADVTMPRVFADHMVLQQNTDVNLWGWADPGESIQIIGSWNPEAVVEAVADAEGNWSVAMATPLASDAPGSHTLMISGNSVLTFSDVLLGEVWVLSGQSNMSIPLIGWDDAPIEGSEEAIANANHEQLRLMVVGEYSASQEQDDIHLSWDYNLRQWASCNPTSVRYFSALGYFFGKDLLASLGNTPVGLIQCAWAGSSCEAWLSDADLQQVKNYRGNGPWATLSSSSDNYTPSVLWNGMLRPIIPYSMRGVLWYQGETNMGRAEELAQLFPQMIQGWRREWKQGDFPFCFSQLAPWSEYWPGQEPELWEAQASALYLANTGMVSPLDLVDADEMDNIHPKRKAPIGARMARWAMANVYDAQTLEYSGPIYESVAINSSELSLSFSHVENGLVFDPIEGETWFEIAGEDGVYFPAQVSLSPSESVITLQSAEVLAPVQARYAWSKLASATLFNLEGLPAPSFRTQPASYVTSHLGNPMNPDTDASVFFVRNGQLMDPTGPNVVGYGVNLKMASFDSENGPIAAQFLPTIREQTGSNLIRIEWNTYAKGTIEVSSQRLDEILQQCVDLEMLVVLSFNDLQGSEDAQAVRGLAASWMQSPYLSVLRKHQEHLILDIQGGWSAGFSPEWHDACFDLISILRGYEGGIDCPLLIEAADHGISLDSIEIYGPNLIAHDPLKNVLFGLEIDVSLPLATQRMDGIGFLKANQFPLLVSRLKNGVVEEWSQTQAMQTAQWTEFLAVNGIGYLGWVWCGDSVNAKTNLTSELDWSSFTPWGSALVQGENGILSLSKMIPSLKLEDTPIPEATLSE